MEMFIKLVPCNSADTVTAFYLQSKGNKQDEVDFEFLGNICEQPYVLNTNVYIQAIGRREQKFNLWFDPTFDFHNHTIHWNPNQTVWFIDGIPIRVFRNHESIGIPYLNKQPMHILSRWNGEDWATEGGRIKINWTYAPFISRFRQFRPRACKWNGLISFAECTSTSAGNYWWNYPIFSKLNEIQMEQMKRVREEYMTYGYCKDTKRFSRNMPPECSHQPIQLS